MRARVGGAVIADSGLGTLRNRRKLQGWRQITSTALKKARMRSSPPLHLSTCKEAYDQGYKDVVGSRPWEHTAEQNIGYINSNLDEKIDKFVAAMEGDDEERRFLRR